MRKEDSMTYMEFISAIEEAYTIITTREESQRKQNLENRFFKTRISFEDIDLDDIFLTKLVPLIFPAQQYYKRGSRELHFKIYKVYVATLCEMAKNGFIQGGINKTIDEYVGTSFNRNRHYDLLLAALKSEKIKIRYEFGHHYEETIIYEAGIPKKLHTQALTLFEIYWKWLKGIAISERHQFLQEFLQEKQLSSVYILDPLDYTRMKNIREAMNTYKAKLFKTCLRLENVISAIDIYPEQITSENIYQVCTKIGEELGRNVFTILRTQDIQHFFLKYARRVSFAKFQGIINGLSNYDNITLPDNRKLTRTVYNTNNFVCGVHIIKGNQYEVSFPIGLTLNELLALDRNVPLRQNNRIIYISNHPFDVEVDGYSKKIRELYHHGEELYIYAGTIPAASTVYIDGISITGDQDVLLSAYIRKYWNSEERKNQLCIYIREFKCSNKKYANESIQIKCGEHIISRVLNSNGFYGFHDKTIVLGDTLPDCIDIIVKGDIIFSKALLFEDILIYGLQYGIPVHASIDLAQWLGDNRIVIYSKEELQSATGVMVELQGKESTYFVYTGKLDFSLDSFSINKNVFRIENRTQPYLTLATNYSLNNEVICYSDVKQVMLQIANAPTEILSNCLLRVTHNGYYKDFPLKDNHSEDISLYNIWNESVDLPGKWDIELFVEQKRVSQIQLAILSKLRVKYDDQVYLESSEFPITILSDSKSFDVDGELTDQIELKATAGKIEHIGSLITSQEIELEIYNATCDVFQTISVRPNIWALRIMELKTQTWFLLSDKRIEFSDLLRYGFFVCSTKSFRIDIIANNHTTTREIMPGYSKIGLRNLFNVWKSINKLTICDALGSTSVATIYYEPQITACSFEQRETELICSFSYSGPIDVPVKISAFTEKNRITYVDRKTFYNNTQLKLHIANPNVFIGQTLNYEVAFFDQDPKNVGNYFVKEQVHHKNYKIEELLSVNTLIDIPIRPIEKDITKYLSIFDLLNLRGMRDGLFD